MSKKEESKGRAISCSKCGRTIELPRKEKGKGCYGRCECGTCWSLGAKLVRITGDTKKLEMPPAITIAQAPPATNAAKKAVAKKEKATKEGGKMSGLSAAVEVLKAANEPLGCNEIVKRMLDGGLWTTNGKTPSATIYSAMLREVQKGAESRFVKTEKGKFALAKK